MYQMWVKQQDNKTVTVALEMGDAQRLLEALKDHQDDIDGAEDLIEQLEEAGIALPEEPDHVRYEYIPPRDLDDGSDHPGPGEAGD